MLLIEADIGSVGCHIDLVRRVSRYRKGIPCLHCLPLATTGKFDLQVAGKDGNPFFPLSLEGVLPWFHHPHSGRAFRPIES